MSMKKALVLFSGGQDSTTCLYWAINHFDEIEAIGFDYGQMHSIELQQANKIANDLKIKYTIYNVKGLLAKSSLTEHSNHNENSYLSNNLPTSFTAGRNLLFINIAASYCAENNIRNIVAGFCQTDFNGYPDCRRNTIDAMQLAISLGLGIGDMLIHTPLMYLSKAETWRLAKELDCIDVIINDTITDYNGNKNMNEWGMGELDNPASTLRAVGYYEAKHNGWL